MARVHARSWRDTYGGLLPDGVIDEVVASQPARIERWRTRLADPERQGGSFVAGQERRVVGFVFWGPSEGAEASAEMAEVYAIYLDPKVIGTAAVGTTMSVTSAARTQTHNTTRTSGHSHRG